MPRISDEKINGVLDMIYETTIDTTSESWLNVYKRISDIFSLGPGGMSFYLDDRNDFDLVASTVDKNLFEDYRNYYGKISPFRKKIEKMEMGERFCRSEVCSDGAFLKTEIYQDHFKKQDVFYLEYEVLFKDANVSSGISFTRSRSTGNFNKKENEAIRLIMPHIRRAFKVFYKVNQTQKDKRIMAEVLNMIPQNVIVVNKFGKAVFVNDNARQILGKNDGLQIDAKGHLRVDLSCDTKKLRRLLNGIFDPNINKSCGYGGTLQIPRPSGLRPFSLLISPITNQPVLTNRSESVALIFITDPEEKTKTTQGILSEIYGLTPAESKLASVLAQGKSLKQACNLLKVKDNTVRTHLKRIFSKTETNRQSDLIRLILTGPANVGKNN